MAKNQKKITIASFNYLLEISAIPKDKRIRFLSHLLRRKNSSTQKNVLLLQKLFQYVDEDKMSFWDPVSICEELDISMPTFYKHKSRLLRGLREFHCGWQETHLPQKNNNSNSLLESMLERAHSLTELGLLKEAKVIYLKLEKDIENSFADNSMEYLMLSDIYENLAYYYYNRRRKRKLLQYINKLSSLKRQARLQKKTFTADQLDLISLRLYYCKFQYQLFSTYRSFQFAKTQYYIQRIYKLSKHFQNLPYLLRILYSKTAIAVTMNNFEQAKKYLAEGCSVAHKLGSVTALHSFKSMEYFMNSKIGNKHTNKSNDENISYYRRVKNSNPMNQWTLFLENSIVQTYYPEKKKDILEIYHEQINSSILRGDYLLSVYWRFIHSLELSNEHLLSFFDIDSIKEKGYLEINCIDHSLLENIEKNCFNILCYQKVINDIGFLWDVYRLQLVAYFFNENDLSYEQSVNVINKMEWL